MPLPGPKIWTPATSAMARTTHDKTIGEKTRHGPELRCLKKRVPLMRAVEKNAPSPPPTIPIRIVANTGTGTGSFSRPK